MNSKNKELLDAFLSYLRDEKRYSENTINAYYMDIIDFIQFLDREELGGLCDVNERTADFYFGELRDKFIPRSIQRKASSLRSFYKYHVNSTKSIETNPLINVVLPKINKRLPKFVYDDEIKVFLNAIDTTNPLGKRDLILFELLYGSGLRVSELTGLKIRDVDFQNRTILVHGKGSKDRLVPMTKKSVEDYKEYLVLARPVFLARNKNMENDHVFLNFHGGSLTSRGVRDILTRVLKETESTIKVSPHALRHSFATHLLNSGMDVRMVQELLGHSNLSTTQIYTKLSKESLQETYDKAFPKGKRHKDD